MNIRFAERSIRCRLTKADLTRLISGRAVTFELALPRSHIFRLSLQPAAIGGWRIESDPTGIWLSAPRTEIERLAAEVPSRDGITHTFELVPGGPLQVDVEVDVRET